ncbi:MAG: hypothetical protein GXP41_03485 [Chloroflexi bacterium]|nr:hypothetical protein [Chloroflexota bacterium]
MSDAQESSHVGNDADMVLPPEAVKVAFLTVREVVGQGGIDTLLRRAGLEEYEGRTSLEKDEQVTFGHIGRLTQAMIDLYGMRGAKAILRRTGRVQFRTWREAYPKAIDTAKVALRAFPLLTRLRLVLNSISLAANQIGHVECHVSQDDDYIFFEACQCPYCSTLQAENPLCETAVGALEELTTWVSNGKRFEVTEVACRALGDPVCRFAILKKPLE